MAISSIFLTVLPGLRMPVVDEIITTHVDYPVADERSDVPAAPATNGEIPIAPAQQTSD